MTKMTTDHRDTKVFDKVFDSSNQASLIPTHSGLDQPLHLGRNTASHTALDPTDRLQDFQNKLTAGIQHATKQTGLSELSQEFDRAANIVDEYRLQALETGSGAIQQITQSKQQLIKRAESFVIEHPEFTDRLDGFKQQIGEVADQVTESLTHQVKSTAKESLLAVYRGMKKAYDISDRFTQEFPSEWQHLKEVLSERTLQAREAVVQPIIGVIDAGFGANEHGDKIVKTITQTNHEANIVEKTGVGNGGWSRSLTEFVDGVKASGKDGIANLSFDLIQKNTDGQVRTRHQLTGQEYQALAYAEQNGVLVVAAAGNDGQTSSWGEASELFNNLVVVGATEGDHQAQYSASGRGLDLLAAGQTEQGTGTSFAAAQVSAIAAEMWSKTPGIKASQLEDLLKATFNPMGAVKQAEALTQQNLGMTNFDRHYRDSSHPTMHDGIDLQSVIWQSLDGATALERTSGWSWSDLNPVKALKKVEHFVEEGIKDGAKFVWKNRHVALDVAGMLPVVGSAADAANAILYVTEGNYKEAAISMVGAVPLIGDTAKVGLKAVHGLNTVRKAEKALEAGKAALEVARVVKSADKALEAGVAIKKIDRVLDLAETVQKIDKSTSVGRNVVKAEKALNVAKATKASTEIPSMAKAITAADKALEASKAIRTIDPLGPLAKTIKTIDHGIDASKQLNRVIGVVKGAQAIPQTIHGATDTYHNIQKGDYRAAAGSAVHTGVAAVSVYAGAHSGKQLITPPASVKIPASLPPLEKAVAKIKGDISPASIAMGTHSLADKTKHLGQPAVSVADPKDHKKPLSPTTTIPTTHTSTPKTVAPTPVTHAPIPTAAPVSHTPVVSHPIATHTPIPITHTPVSHPTTTKTTIPISAPSKATTSTTSTTSSSHSRGR